MNSVEFKMSTMHRSDMHENERNRIGRLCVCECARVRRQILQHWDISILMRVSNPMRWDLPNEAYKQRRWLWWQRQIFERFTRNVKQTQLSSAKTNGFLFRMKNDFFRASIHIISQLFRSLARSFARMCVCSILIFIYPFCVLLRTCLLW